MGPRGERDGDGLILPRPAFGTRRWTDDGCLDSRKIEVAMGLLVDQYLRRLPPDPGFRLPEREYVFRAPHYANGH